MSQHKAYRNHAHPKIQTQQKYVGFSFLNWVILILLSILEYNSVKFIIFILKVVHIIFIKTTSMFLNQIILKLLITFVQLA